MLKPTSFSLPVSLYLACLCLSVAVPLPDGGDRGATLTAAALVLPDVFWSSELESRMPAALFDGDRGREFLTRARTRRVVQLQRGCGRMKNRMAVLEDGTKACCRYRDSLRDLRGDVYAYHLSGLMELWNTPPVAAVKADFSSGRQLRSVVEEAKKAGWMDGGYFIMSLYVDDLGAEHIPDIFKKGRDSKLTSASVANCTDEERVHLMQWSDMIIFDFLMGHVDRVFSHLVNLQWNSKMMDKAVHNLEKTDSGTLVLLDNESAFWMGYMSGRKRVANYALQLEFLKRTCLFRESTIAAVNKLLASARPDVVLEEFVKAHDPFSYEAMPKLNAREREDFRLRLEAVMEQVQTCGGYVSVTPP